MSSPDIMIKTTHKEESWRLEGSEHLRTAQTADMGGLLRLKGWGWAGNASFCAHRASPRTPQTPRWPRPNPGSARSTPARRWQRPGRYRRSFVTGWTANLSGKKEEKKKNRLKGEEYSKDTLPSYNRLDVLESSRAHLHFMLNQIRTNSYYNHPLLLEGNIVVERTIYLSAPYYDLRSGVCVFKPQLLVLQSGPHICLIVLFWGLNYIMYVKLYHYYYYSILIISENNFLIPLLNNI